MTRGSSSWINLNGAVAATRTHITSLTSSVGLWQFQPGAANQSPPFNKTLSTQILVPFPVESCLSGIGAPTKRLFIVLMLLQVRTISTCGTASCSTSHRRSCRAPRASCSTLAPWTGKCVLFAHLYVDFCTQTNVYINGKLLGTHEGGYDGFSFDITANVRSDHPLSHTPMHLLHTYVAACMSQVQHLNNELIVGVYDPSDLGSQARPLRLPRTYIPFYSPTVSSASARSRTLVATPTRPPPASGRPCGAHYCCICVRVVYTRAPVVPMLCGAFGSV